MAPLIVSWPGGAFPTTNTLVKGGARKKRSTRKATRKQKRRTMKQRRCGYRRSCA